MSFDFDFLKLIQLGILTSGIHWAIGRSKIAQPLWSRAKGKLAELLACPACSGWWIGIALGLLGLTPILTQFYIANVLLTGLLGLWTAPIFEAAFLWGLSISAIELDYMKTSSDSSASDDSSD
jgi:hypothetical protein